MDKIDETFKRINAKIEMLNKCMLLIQNKGRLAPQLQETVHEVSEIEQVNTLVFPEDFLY